RHRSAELPERSPRVAEAGRSFFSDNRKRAAKAHEFSNMGLRRPGNSRQLLRTADARTRVGGHGLPPGVPRRASRIQRHHPFQDSEEFWRDETLDLRENSAVEPVEPRRRQPIQSQRAPDRLGGVIFSPPLPSGEADERTRSRGEG